MATAIGRHNIEEHERHEEWKEQLDKKILALTAEVELLKQVNSSLRTLQEWNNKKGSN